MIRSRIAVAACAAAAWAAAAIGSQALPELRIVPGRAAQGEISFDGEEDRIAVDLIAGAKLTFTAKASKKSKLRTAADLYDAAGALITVDAAQRAATPTSATIKNWVAPATGTFLLGVRGTAAGPTGLYDLATKLKPAPKPAKVTSSIEAVEVDEFGFDALAGTVAAITLKDTKGSQLIPRVRAIVAPDQTTLDLSGAKRKSLDKSDTLKGLVLPQFGHYIVRVEGGGSTGGYTLTFALKAPAVPKTKLDFRGASGGESSAGAITSIEILPHVVALDPSKTQQMLAKATYADGRVRDGTRAVTWAARDRNVATVSNAMPCGLATAVAAGGTTIEAWAGAVEARSALVLVGGTTVSGVSIVPAAPAVAPGNSISLQAVATLSSGGPVEVTKTADWAATGGVGVTLNGSALTAGAAPGTAQITASAGGATSLATDVTVTAHRVERIAVSPAYAELSSGSGAFSATATFSDGTTGDVTSSVTWSSDNAAAATMTGATASFVAPGTAGIRATFDGVSSRPAVLNCGGIALQSVVVNAAATVPHGATRDFTADGVFADGGTRDVTEAAAWSSDAQTVVAVETTAGIRGRVTGLADSGAATITAAVSTGAGVRNGQAATAAALAERTNLFVVPRIGNVTVGATVPFRAFFRRTDGSLEDVTSLAAWTSSAPSVATVAGGTTTGVADGGSVLSASLDGKTASAIVLSGVARIQNVAALAPPPTPVGATSPASATATFFANGAESAPDSVGTAADWFSSDPLSLGVGATGDAVARRIGSADLTAVVGGIASSPAAVSGIPPQERSLLVFPQAARSPSSANVQLAAQVTSSDGSVADRAATAAWDSGTPSVATVNATGLVHAVAKGTSSITATRNALSDSRPFTVLSDPPTISGVSPATLARGASGAVVTINGANLDGTGLSVSFSGSGVSATAAPVPNGAGTQATVTVNVDVAAALGARDLTYTTISGSATKTGAVTVQSITPTITSVSPSNIDVPASGSVAPTVVVTGTNFSSGDALLFTSHAGVSLSNLSVVNSTTISVTVTVQSNTQNGRLDATVQQSPGAGGQSVTLANALKIGPADPTVSAFSPAYFQVGVANASGTITGTNFNSGIAVSFTGASGNFTYSSTRQSATLITFQITPSSNASAGLYDLVLQNTSDLTRTFAGLLALVPRDPAVSSFSAVSLSRGVSNAAVVVLGSNFGSGDTLSASGAGVTFSSVTVVSPEKITANASVAANATISTRDVTVSHATTVGGRGGTLKNALRVTDAVPTVTSCNPSAVGRTGSGGPTRRVPVTVTGTDFCDGATVSVTRTSSSGITVVSNPAAVLSDTQLSFEIDVTGAATVGSWDVKVTNPGSLGDSGTSGNAKLSIVSETTLAVNRVVAPTGSALGGDHVTVYGSGFVRGCEVDFGTQKALASQFIDQNTLVCTVPAPANPSNASSSTVSKTATTYVDVKVTVNPGTGSAASATLTGGYGYLANATVFKILQSYPAYSSTGNPQSLRSAVVRLSDSANTSTATIGTTQGTNCQWFESGGVRPTSPTCGFGADRRFLVFSRTSTGNLAAISLPPNTGKYVLETPTAVRSASGTALLPSQLAQPLAYDQWFFTISTSVTDTTAPTLSTSTPAASATGVATNTQIVLTFSEEIDPLTVTASSITLKQGSTQINCDVALSTDIKTVTLTPYAELATSTQYTVAVTGTVADLSGNAISTTSQTFTTGSGTDTTAPTIDSVVFEQIPADMDGSGTYVAGTDTPASTTNSTAAFDLYLPRSAWKVVVTFSDTGGAGVDEAQFSAKASVAVGSSSANAELASKFSVTSTRAEWTVASSDAFTAGEDVTLTFLVKDKSGNTSSSKVVTFDVVDITATALGSGGGNLDPFDARETWVLRFDRDVYSATLSTNGTTQQCTTTAASNGILDLEEGLRISGLATANMTTDAANTVNGPSVGTNAIVVRLVCERIRATLNARYGIGEDGSRGADAADIEFLLPGEQGSLTALPQWSTSSSGTSSKAFSEMDIGGDTGPNSSQTGSFTAIGFAFIDTRNRNHEADMNDGLSAGNNNGIFAINMAKGVMNASTTGTTWGARVLKNFQTAKGGTPIGEGSLDDDVLAGSFDRTSASNSAAMNDRYDKIMDAIESSALSVSSTAAHEIGHSLGLVPDAGPKTGFFGNAPRANTFTEATASFPNTSAHLNALGNDVMSPVSSIDQRAATGSDFMRFSAYDHDYLLHRQVHDEGR